MGSKVIVLSCLLLAMVILISTEVSARDLAETSNTVDTSTNPEQYGGGYGGRGGGKRGGGYCRYGRCCGRYKCRCCSYAGEKSDANFKGEMN